MVIFGILIFLLSVLLFGYLTLLRLKLDFGFWANAALSFGLGSGLVTIQLFIWMFLLRQSHVAPGFVLLLLIELSVLLYFLWPSLDLKNIGISPIELKGKELALLAVILAQSAAIMFSALTRPVVTSDSLSMWSLKAKALYYSGKVDFLPEGFFYLGGGGHVNYPWHLPLFELWFYKCLGSFDDLAANLLPFMYLAFLLALAYAAARKYFSRSVALSFCLLLSTMPLISYHSYNMYADLPLGFFAAAAFFLLWEWINNRQPSSLLASGLFMGLAWWTKSEGLIYLMAGAIVFVLVSRRRALKEAKLLLGGLAIILPWLMYLWYNELGISNVEPGLGLHPEVLGTLANTLFVGGNWNIFWYAVVAVLLYALMSSGKSKIWWAWLYLGLCLGGFAAMYLVTNNFRYALDYTAVARNILASVPLSVLVVIITLGESEKSKKNQ